MGKYTKVRFFGMLTYWSSACSDAITDCSWPGADTQSWGVNLIYAVDDTLLQYLSPLGWEHIDLTGDYLWRSSARIGAGKFRPLRPLKPA